MTPASAQHCLKLKDSNFARTLEGLCAFVNAGMACTLSERPAVLLLLLCQGYGLTETCAATIGQ
jgi:hypothetical protein